MKEICDINENQAKEMVLEMGKVNKKSTQSNNATYNQPLPDDSCDSVEMEAQELEEEVLGKDKQDPKKSKKPIFIGSGKPVGTFELYFKFASKSDQFLIVLAMIGSLGSGISMPLFSILFGGMD